jgi:tetratricopeptide (TPR) repeat protein
LDPSNAKSFANRASVLARLGRYEEALNDCNSAIDIDPSYTKALTKRDIILQHCQGTAKSELKTRMTTEEVGFEEGDEIQEEVFTPGSMEFECSSSSKTKSSPPAAHQDEDTKRRNYDSSALCF